MVERLHSFLGPNAYRAGKTVSYGSEWGFDDFDRLIDKILGTTYRADLQKSPDSPRSALVIGCGTGLRAYQLAASGFFDEVVTCDIADRSAHIEGRNNDLAHYFRVSAGTTTRRICRPMTFRQSNIATLGPEDFGETKFAYIDFRNVSHFLVPIHLRQTLSNFYHWANDNGFVGISFDADDSPGQESNSIFQRASLFNNDPPHIYYSNHGQPYFYESYRVSEVSSHLTSSNFQIIPHCLDRARNDVRWGEGHIIAWKGCATNMLFIPLCTHAMQSAPSQRKPFSTDQGIHCD